MDDVSETGSCDDETGNETGTVAGDAAEGENEAGNRGDEFGNEAEETGNADDGNVDGKMVAEDGKTGLFVFRCCSDVMRQAADLDNKVAVDIALSESSVVVDIQGSSAGIGELSVSLLSMF